MLGAPPTRCRTHSIDVESFEQVSSQERAPPETTSLIVDGSTYQPNPAETSGDIRLIGYGQLIACYTRSQVLARGVKSICFYDQGPNEIGDNTFSFLLSTSTNGLPGRLPNPEHVIIRAPLIQVSSDVEPPQAELQVARTCSGEPSTIRALERGRATQKSQQD